MSVRHSVIVFIYLFFSVAFASQHLTASFYIDAFGRVDEAEHPIVTRVNEVYKRVSQFAFQSDLILPGLVVIDSNFGPWAITLPDKNIILSLGAIQICYKDVTKEQGDARIAFVLSHEISHLYHNEFWQHDFVNRLIRSAEFDDIRHVYELVQADANRSIDEKYRKLNELRADDAGFINAALSGYDVWNGLTANNDSFFRVWDAEVGSAPEKTHFSDKTRHKMLKDRIRSLQNDARFASFALLLEKLGKYKDAKILLEELVQQFQTPQLLTSLAKVNVMLALNGAASRGDGFLLLPTISKEHGLESFDKSIVKAELTGFKERLAESIKLLNHVVSNFPGYSPGYINLAIAYHYIDQHHHARANIEKALQLNSEDWYAKLLKNLIIYNQEKEIDMWPRIVSNIEKLQADNVNNDLIRYNLAVLYQKRKRTEEASALAQKILSVQNSGSVLFEYACMLESENQKCTSLQSQQQQNLPETVKAWLQAGYQTESYSQTVRKKILDSVIKISLGRESEDLYINDVIVARVVKNFKFKDDYCADQQGSLLHDYYTCDASVYKEVQNSGTHNLIIGF